MNLGELNQRIVDKGLVLENRSEGLTLKDIYGNEMRGDLTKLLSRIKRNNLSQELLVRAAKIKDIEGTPKVIDATAGMGEDSLLLAAAGFEVFLYENDPIIAALLKDALERALDDSEHPQVQEAVGRMHFYYGDSIEAMKEISFIPDVIYLDPMFPERKKSAQVKKKFQLIHGLEKPCMNETELLKAAYLSHPHKIVIKRPVKGPYLADIKPSYSLTGKAVRYDCIVLPRPASAESSNVL